VSQKTLLILLYFGKSGLLFKKVFTVKFIKNM